MPTVHFDSDFPALQNKKNPNELNKSVTIDYVSEPTPRVKLGANLSTRACGQMHEIEHIRLFKILSTFFPLTDPQLKLLLRFGVWLLDNRGNTLGNVFWRLHNTWRQVGVRNPSPAPKWPSTVFRIHRPKNWVGLNYYNEMLGLLGQWTNGYYIVQGGP